MGFIKKVLLALSVAVVAYYVYNPLPPNVEQPMLYNMLTVVFRIIEDLSRLSDFLGYKEQLVFRRDALHLAIDVMNTKPTDINITDTTLNGVPVRIYSSLDENDAKGLRAGFIYVHGGGFVVGLANYGDAHISRIVRATGVTVMSIVYRLAPEYPSPAQLEDCETASQYFLTHAKSFGVDPGRIGVVGDSAGGNMAAVLSIRNRDRPDGPRFAYQVLIYPWVQGLNLNLPSHLENEAFVPPYLSRYGLAQFVAAYTGVHRDNAVKIAHNRHVSEATQTKYKSFFDTKDLHRNFEESKKMKSNPELTEDLGPEDKELSEMMKAHITNPDNFPLMAESVADLPPALVMTMGYDPLRDEGLLYLRRLGLAGVETEHYHDSLCWHASLSAIHGFFTFDCGERLLFRIIKYIGQQSYRDFTD